MQFDDDPSNAVARDYSDNKDKQRPSENFKPSSDGVNIDELMSHA